MRKKLGLRNLVALAIIALTLAAMGGDAFAKSGGYDPPVSVPSTDEEPIDGTPVVTLPTPVWEYEPAVLEDGSLVLEMPATGAGTTAREVKSANHYSSRHYISTICWGGYWQNKYGAVAAVLSDGTHYYQYTWLESQNYRCY